MNPITIERSQEQTSIFKYDEIVSKPEFVEKNDSDFDEPVYYIMEKMLHISNLRSMLTSVSCVTAKELFRTEDEYEYLHESFRYRVDYEKRIEQIDKVRKFFLKQVGETLQLTKDEVCRLFNIKLITNKNRTKWKKIVDYNQFPEQLLKKI